VKVRVPTSGVLVETLRLDPDRVGTAVISGEVRREESARPVPGAHVHRYGATTDVLTASDGSFILTDVPFGTQSIEVTALGFSPRRYALDITTTGTSRVTITMSAVGTVLDSVKIPAKAMDAHAPHAEFDERSAHGAGQYITQEMIAEAHPLQTAELMQQASGYYVMSDTVYSSRGITRIELSADPKHAVNRVCKPAIYVNGNPTVRTMNDIPPNMIYGIEIYASAAEVPPQYPAANCGAILIWTK
jgi:hypothetical protein